MFADVVGYTSLTQENEASALALVQDLAKILRPLFTKFGGREVKTMGDAFLVEFSSALSATHCAIDIQRTLYENNVATTSRRIELRIGIHVGDLVYRSSDVFGDAVNIASRIEPLANPGGICISQQVYDQVWNKIEQPIVGMGKRELKNVQFATEVFRIALPWEKEGMDGESKRTTPLVDRKSELSTLKLALEKAVQGNGNLIFVVGEAGIGKTRLADELTTSAKQKGYTTLFGRCSRREGKVPYAPWIEQFRELVRNSSPQLLYKIVGNHGAEIAKLVPEITNSLGPISGPISTSVIATGSIDQERIRFIDSVVQFVLNLSRESPVLLVMDDMNWADSGSLDLLLAASRQTQGRRILMIGVYRDVEVEEDSDLFEFLYDVKREKLGDTLTLRGFDVDDTGRVISEILNQQGIDRELRDLVYEKTGGNPFFIEELVRSLIEQGVIFHTVKGWEKKPLDQVEIPSGIRTVIKQRLNNLDPESQTVLSVASVTSSASKEFSFELLRMVTGIEENHLIDVLERILKTHLIKEIRLSGGRPGFIFADTRVRDAIYEEITLLRRSRYHLKTAQSIEELYKGRLEDVYGVLVYHFLRANDPKECLEYAIKAADKSASVFAHGEAMKYLKIALEVLEESPDRPLRIKVLQDLGDSAWASGRGDFAKYSEEAAKLCVENGDKIGAARIYRQLAMRLNYSNKENVTIPTEYFDRAKKLLEGQEETEESAYLYNSLGRFNFLIGHLPEAAELTRKALALADKLSIPEVQAHAYLTLAVVLTNEPKESRAQYMQKALKIGLEHNFADVIFRSYNNLTFESEIIAEGLKHSLEGLAYMQRIGHAVYEDLFKNNVAEAYVMLGETEKGISTANELLASTISPATQMNARFVLAEAFLYQGKFEECKKSLDGILSSADKGQDFQYILGSENLIGAMYAESGDLQSSEVHLKKGADVIREKGLKAIYIYGALVSANLLYSTEILIKKGLVEEAKKCLKEVQDLASASRTISTNAFSMAIEGKILSDEGNVTKAKEALSGAADGFRKIGHAFYLAKTLEELGVVCQRAGDIDGSGIAFNESRKIFESIGGKFFSEKVLEHLEARPV